MSLPMSPTDEPRRPTGPSAPAWTLLAALVAVGLALRVWEAVESSLWLDELHTLSHASQVDLAGVSAAVARDNHTPLFFWVVHLLGDWSGGEWLRLLPALTSLLVLVPAVLLLREVGVERGAGVLLGAWLLMALPYQVYFSAMLRPYAWVGLFSAGAVWAAFSDRGSHGARFAIFFSCVLAGLWTHRVMALVLLGVGCARLVTRIPGALGLGWLILSGALAVAPMVPWLARFAEERTVSRLEFQQEAGGYELRPVLVKEVLALPARLFVPFMGTLGRPWALLAKLGALTFFGTALASMAAFVLARRRGQTSKCPPAMAALTVYAAVTFLLIAATSLWSWDRVPLQYFTAVAWAPPVILACAANRLPRPGMRMAAMTLLSLSALVAGVAQSGGRETEDMRRAVATVGQLDAQLRKRDGARPVVSAMLSQPEMFRHDLPYRVYGPELGAVEPDQIPRSGTPGFERPVVLLLRDESNLRSSDSWSGLGAPVFEGRVELERLTIDWYLTVLVLGPEFASDGGGR